jgi:hypothetical protein
MVLMIVWSATSGVPIECAMCLFAEERFTSEFTALCISFFNGGTGCAKTIHNHLLNSQQVHENI